MLGSFSDLKTSWVNLWWINVKLNYIEIKKQLDLIFYIIKYNRVSINKVYDLLKEGDIDKMKCEILSRENKNSTTL